jgi:hypothetical protein
MILRALQSTLTRIWLLKRLWLLYYLTGFLFAALVAIPARSIISSYAGNTLMAGRLSGRMDLTFLIELLQYRGEAIKPLFLITLLLAALFWLLLLFLSGGTLKLLGKDHPYRPREFWDACGRYFGRFVRLFLWSLPLLALLLLLPSLVTLVERIIWGKDPAEPVAQWCTYIKMGGRYLALLLWAVCFDYARITAMQKNEKKTRRLLLPLLRFIGSHFVRLSMLALLLAVLSLLALGVYLLIAGWLRAPSAVVITLLFLWQQLYMLLRAGLRLLSLGSQLKLYQEISRN